MLTSALVVGLAVAAIALIAIVPSVVAVSCILVQNVAADGAARAKY